MWRAFRGPEVCIEANAHGLWCNLDDSDHEQRSRRYRLWCEHTGLVISGRVRSSGALIVAFNLRTMQFEAKAVMVEQNEFRLSQPSRACLQAERSRNNAPSSCTRSSG